VLIEFGSVVGAVQCAAELQKLVAERNAGSPAERRMEWRIGAHLGDVLIDGDDILGDGVNIAARLEGIADPGGICISEDTFRQVRGKVEAEFADIGEQSLLILFAAQQCSNRPSTQDRGLTCIGRLQRPSRVAGIS
jgi:adenylate cyclase